MKKKTKRIILIIGFIGFFAFYATSSGIGLFDSSYENLEELFEEGDTDLNYLGKYETSNVFNGIAILKGSIVLNDEYNSQTHLIDRSVPSDLSFISDISGNYENGIYSPITGVCDIFFMASAYGLERYDATDPENMVFTGYLINTEVDLFEYRDGLVYIFERNGEKYNTFTVLNASADLSLSENGIISNYTAPSLRIDFQNMYIVEDLAILGYQDGIIIVNISNPFNMQYIGEYETELPQTVVKYNDILYLSDTNGLKALNASDLTDMTPIKEYKGDDYLFKNFIGIGSFAVGYRNTEPLEGTTEFQLKKSLICLDLGDPNNVTIIAENYDLDVYNLLLHNELLYILGDYYLDGDPSFSQDMGLMKSGLIILGITDVLELEGSTDYGFSSFSSLTSVEDIDTQGTLVYVADGNNGIKVIDFSNTTDPAEIGSLSITGYIED
ncbi:MAG: hypothetical protein GF364_05740, partial [Candidatus Lokiarchaeota archaeon]|nr:hypothetical protein [Candidatus Lokiarchaeota archaeon]